MFPPSDDDVFLEDNDAMPPAAPSHGEASPWRVLVVDDDEQLHAVTRMVLNGLIFGGRPIELVPARSGRDAVEILARDNDFALVLLDVVMETDAAGLETVVAIRENLRNQDIRIVLRTGEPGLAPEREVIARYEIDGYESKATLTAQKLHTLVITALRSFQYIRAIQAHREGLELVIDATASIIQARSLDRFAEGVLTQLEAMVGCGSKGIFCTHLSPSDPRSLDACRILASCGAFAGLVGSTLGELPESADVIPALERSLADGRPVAGGGGVALAVRSPHDKLALAWVACAAPRDIELRLVGHFAANLSAGFDAIGDICDARNQVRVLTRTLAAVLGQPLSLTLPALTDVLARSGVPPEVLVELQQLDGACNSNE
jgi:CheY-like chemotaxis protein